MSPKPTKGTGNSSDYLKKIWKRCDTMKGVSFP